MSHVHGLENSISVTFIFFTNLFIDSLHSQGKYLHLPHIYPTLGCILQGHLCTALRGRSVKVFMFVVVNI